MSTVLLLIRVGLALFFIGFGLTKLFGWHVEVELFDKIGWGTWFRYFTGAVEIAVGVLLLVPGLQFVGAVMLLGVLAGATLTQVAVLGNHAPVREIALIAVTLFLAWAYRAQGLALIERWQ